MNTRHHAEQQVAIGFPRQYIQSLGLTPAWYLKHNPEIVTVLRKWEASDPGAFGKVKPFIDEDEDVAPFQEIRTTGPVDIGTPFGYLRQLWMAKTVPLYQTCINSKPNMADMSESFWHQ